MVSVTMNHDAVVTNASVDAGDLLIYEFGGSSSPSKTNTTAIIISVVVIGQVIILVIIGAAVARYCKRKNESRAAREEEMEHYDRGNGRRINGGDSDRGLMNNNYDNQNSNRGTERTDRSSPYTTPRRGDFYGNASPNGSNPLFNSNTSNNGNGNDNRGYANDNRGYANDNRGYANDNRGNRNDNRGNDGYGNNGNGNDNRGNGYNY